MERENRSPKSERLTAVKLIAGLLYPSDASETKAWTVERLSHVLGEIERESVDYVWDYTGYYRDISPALTRCFFSFKGLMHPMGLPDWKRIAVKIEHDSAEPEGAGRRVNVDPGYLDGARLVLASTKDNAQRIYLRDDIYAEVTMCRGASGWEKFRHTFPDFKSGVYDDFFDAVRSDWRRDVREYRKRLNDAEPERN